MSDSEQTTEQDAPQAQTPQQVPDTTQGQESTEATFTQADVDAIVGKRAQRAKETAKSEFLADLGVDDFDDLKSLVETIRKKQEEELSEVEKALQQADKERKAREQAEQRAKEIESRYVARDREIAFKDAARKAGATDVNRLHILVQAEKQADLTALFDDDGATFNQSEMDKFIKQVQSDYDNYFATAGAGSPSKSGGQVPTQVPMEDVEKDISSKFGKL